MQLSKDCQFAKGLSLLEGLLALAIIGLLAASGMPTIVSAMHHQQLKGAVKKSYFLMQTARTSAISQNQDITVQAKTGNNWCLALSDSGPCDCQSSKACTVNQLEHRVDFQQFPNIVLSKITMGKDQAIIFDSTRGIAVGNAGSAVFNSDQSIAKLIVSNLGRVRICMVQGNMGAFQPC